MMHQTTVINHLQYLLVLVHLKHNKTATYGAIMDVKLY